MCLAVPAKIIEIKIPGEIAEVETLGVSREAVISVVDDDIQKGDYVLIHAGFAIRKINTKEAERTIELHRQLALMENQTHKDNTDEKGVE